MKSFDSGSNQVILKEYSKYISKILSSKDGPFKEKHLRKLILNSFKDASCSCFFTSLCEFTNQTHMMARWKILIILHTFLNESQYHKNLFEYVSKMLYMLSPPKKSDSIFDSLCEEFSFLLATKLTFLINIKFIKGDYSLISKTLPYPFKAFSSGLQYITELTQQFELHLTFISRILHICSRYGENASIDPESKNKLQSLIPVIQDCENMYSLLESATNYLNSIAPNKDLEPVQNIFIPIRNKWLKTLKILANINFIRMSINLTMLREDEQPIDVRQNEKTIEKNIVKEEVENQKSIEIIEDKSSSVKNDTNDYKYILPATNVQDPNINRQLKRVPGPSEDKSNLNYSSSYNVGHMGSNIDVGKDKIPEEDSRSLNISDGVNYLDDWNVNNPPNSLQQDKIPNSLLPTPQNISGSTPSILSSIFTEEKLQNTDTIIQNLKDQIEDMKKKINPKMSNKSEEEENNKILISELKLQKHNLEENLQKFESKNKELQNLLISQKNISNQNLEYKEKFEKLKDIYSKLREEYKTKENNFNKNSNNESEIIKKYQAETQELNNEIKSLKIQIDTLEIIQKNTILEKEKLLEMQSQLNKKVSELNELNKLSSNNYDTSQKETMNNFMRELFESVNKGITKCQNYEFEDIDKNILLKIIKDFSEKYSNITTFLPSYDIKSNRTTLMQMLVEGCMIISQFHSSANALILSTDCESQDFKENISKAIGLYSALIGLLLSDNYANSSIKSNFSNMKTIMQDLEYNIQNIPEKVKEEPFLFNFDEEISIALKQLEEAAKQIENSIKENSAANILKSNPENEKILKQFKEFINYIQKLIIISDNLQSEISKQGGTDCESTQKKYKDSSQWNEGLLSSAKSIGKAAANLVSIANGLISKETTIEELNVSLNGVMAGIIQLVSASRVKADQNSKNLAELLEGSKIVRRLAANIVAYSRAEFTPKNEQECYDFSTYSRTKARTIETEIQIRVLELESLLSKENEKLRRIRESTYKLQDG